MSDTKVFFCNKTYNERWFTDIESSNGIHYKIIHAIIDEATLSGGGQIRQADILEKHEDIREYLVRRPFRLIPSSGTELTGNGRGIHHAKYSPTKSVAVLWQRIDGLINFTFDDHAPIKYHRAIYSFSQLRIGRQIFPLNSKCSRLTREILKSDKPWRYKGVDLRKRFYAARG
ncbi:hypothetical protein MUG10_09685 [Xanthomonas prunicola]|uniref:Uncharacterized protein n=1 Tax=Xanthomonas prunicola TaxID=2053930 RepID=A0A9Q9MZ80_9XANT|nr:hypothetical protein [Xanthomonas prunicola]USJ02336.1 hypothetical protein MUG10_09685 [Xanthomonas prunicola]UXA50849.1 hypothetical protein M0D44_10410 [Xanthomonas prunicola]UXA59157.1 hypothetical protein M0D47_10450 [Xanthomonas prunicola]UXA61296.1 hypothetical protein M0D48_20735 [Xanthomonas prunicola]UXA67365.1 hypothetical protein M0D43_10675 [Xanthomonas prunicola]